MPSKAAALRALFATQPIIRIVGAHHGLGAKLIERSGFDGVWASGLEMATARGVPDASILTMTEHLEAAAAINEATRLPVVCDCDTGYGNAANVMHMVKRYERSGIAAVVIEDKRFPKLNSFVPGRQELAPIDEFVGKLEAAKAARQDPDVMVFARLEALIAGWGIEEALRRAAAYEAAGADGLVVHSKARSPDEIFTFAKRWRGAIPLVAIPTTYPQVTTDELVQHGFRMVIYANHGLRAQIRAMDETFRAIAASGSSAAVEGRLASLEEVFELQGMRQLREDEQRFVRRERAQAIIPAAGDHARQAGLQDLLAERPLCMLEIGGETLISRQLGLLRSSGIADAVIVGGHQCDRIEAAGADVIRNPEHATRQSAHSIMLAVPRISGKCVVVYSDILFDRQILERLLESPHPVTLVIDRAYQTLPAREKQLDLVIAEGPAGSAGPRRLQLSTFKPIRRIGKGLDARQANSEFIGMAFFREEGVRALAQAWDDALGTFAGRPFHEAPRPEQASFTDLIQHLIERGVPVHGMEIEHGWSEIHSLEDYQRLNAYYQGLTAGAAR